MRRLIVHMRKRPLGKGIGSTHAALERAHQQALEDFSRFVAVADVFEGFGGVLAADVEEDFFAASVGEGRVSWVGLGCESGTKGRTGARLRMLEGC